MSTSLYTPVLQVPFPPELKKRLKTIQKMIHDMRVHLAKGTTAQSDIKLLLSPCAMVANAVALGSILVTGFLVSGLVLAVLVQLGVAVLTWGLAFTLVPLPRSFAQVLDHDLLHYDPIDKIAYRRFQQKVKCSATRELSPKDFFDWVNLERNAIENAQRIEKLILSDKNGIKNTTWKFVNKAV